MSYDFHKSLSFQREQNFKKKWFSSYHYGASPRSLENMIESIKILENNNTFSNEIIIIYNIQKFMPLYVSKNVEKILGYTREEFLGWKEGAFLRIGAVNQPLYFKNLSNWVEDFGNTCPPMTINSHGRFHLAGVRYRHKDGSHCRFMVRQEIKINEDLTMPEFAILFYEDISHLIKGDDYWMFFEGYDDKEIFSKFYRIEGIDSYPISSREKQVLKLVMMGKSTKEIGNELNISPQTVAKHRKNMLNRMMAKDSSSLIQLCKMCNVI